jgi:hypothetical protein
MILPRDFKTQKIGLCDTNAIGNQPAASKAAEHIFP